MRGIYHENSGWFDENQATMYDLPAASIYPDLVQLAGGAGAIVHRAEALLNDKDYVKMLHLTEVALSAEPNQQQALAVCIQALKALKAGIRNYIENIWLYYGIRAAE